MLKKAVLKEMEFATGRHPVIEIDYHENEAQRIRRLAREALERSRQTGPIPLDPYHSALTFLAGGPTFRVRAKKTVCVQTGAAIHGQTKTFRQAISSLANVDGMMERVREKLRTKDTSAILPVVKVKNEILCPFCAVEYCLSPVDRGSASYHRSSKIFCQISGDGNIKCQNPACRRLFKLSILAQADINVLGQTVCPACRHMDSMLCYSVIIRCCECLTYYQAKE